MLTRKTYSTKLVNESALFIKCVILFNTYRQQATFQLFF